MKKIAIFLITVIIFFGTSIPVSAMFPPMIRWEGTLYFTREQSYMYTEEYIEKNYTLLGEIELVVDNDAEIPEPSAENKATSNDFTVGDKIYKGNSNGKLYVLVSKTYQPITGRTRLCPMTAEKEDISLGAGVEESIYQ